jgi:arsenite-transporting ATPase
VLIISTDPAHNLSDAFDQKFTSKPTQVKNFENLFAMEVDPTANEGGSGGNFLSGLMGQMGGASAQDEEASQESIGFMKDLMASVPGIDEATSFGEVIKSLDEYNFSLIIFDTAPTGHTLRLLNFPNILEKGLVKLIELKDKFGGMFAQVQGMMSQNGQPGASQEDAQQRLFDGINSMKTKIEEVNEQFKDENKTTFVAVCIPEFLSMYETERLAIELAKQEIDIHNIVIN